MPQTFPPPAVLLLESPNHLALHPVCHRVQYVMSWSTEQLFWSDDEQLAAPSQNPTQRGQRVRVVHRTPCSNCTQTIHPASGCKCFWFLRPVRLSNLFVNAVTHSLFSSSHFHSLPPSSSCTSRPRLSRASRNKLLQHRAAPLWGIPRLIRCKFAYSRVPTDYIIVILVH
jgi:hypothetical protein